MSVSAHLRSAASCSSSSSNWRSRTWKRHRPRKRPRPRSRLRKPRGRNADVGRAARASFPTTCRLSASSSPRPARAASAAGRGCASSAKSSPRRSNASRADGRSSSACARSSPAATVRRSPSRPRRRILIPRGFAGPSLLAMILVVKFADHLPLNRQSAAFAREGIELDTSTLADWVGGCVAALDPVLAELRRHVLAAERLHVDDTTVPVLAKTKTRTGRLWTYVRDDRPFGGQGPPAALFDYSPSRHGEHPRRVLAAWSGVMQADAFSGYNTLYAEGRKPGRIFEAACWAHGRRDFFDLAKLSKAPIATEIVRRIDELFAIERDINGKPPDLRHAARQERSKAVVAALEAYMREQYERLSPKNEVAKAIRYMLVRWASFTRFLDDGRICLSNNAAERALRGAALGRRNWTFAGSDEGGRRAAAVYSLITTCKLNDVDPRAWLAEVLARLPDHPINRVDELLPWNWKARTLAPAPAIAAVAA